MIEKFRIWLSEKMTRWALTIAPGEYVPIAFALCAGAFSDSGFTPPAREGSNERTKRTKAKRKRQLQRLRQLEQQQREGRLVTRHEAPQQ
jgi:hypothetical protein